MYKFHYSGAGGAAAALTKLFPRLDTTDQLRSVPPSGLFANHARPVKDGAAIFSYWQSVQLRVLVKLWLQHFVGRD